MSNLVSHNGTSIICSNERHVYTVFCRQMWICPASLLTCLEAACVRQWTLANAHCFSSQLISSDLTLSSVSTLFLIWKWLASNWLQAWAVATIVFNCIWAWNAVKLYFLSEKEVDDVAMKNKVWCLTSRPLEWENTQEILFVWWTQHMIDISKEEKLYEDRFSRRKNQNF